MISSYLGPVEQGGRGVIPPPDQLTLSQSLWGGGGGGGGGAGYADHIISSPQDCQTFLRPWAKSQEEKRKVTDIFIYLRRLNLAI